jgi:adenylate cyclase
VLGLVCAWTSRSDRAIAEFREAAKLNPSFTAALICVGQRFSYMGQPQEAIPLIERAIRLSPTDPRMFISLMALAHAHYEARCYEEAIEVGRRSWTLNRNWPGGLRYVVSGLGQLGRIEEAQAPLAELKRFYPDLAHVEELFTRLYEYQAGLDQFLQGLRKAGFE